MVDELERCATQSCKDEVQAEYKKISDVRDNEYFIATIECTFGFCDSFNKIYEELRLSITTEGNAYFLENITQRNEFIQLPDENAVFHNYPTDKNGNVINVISGAKEGYSKWIHPILGYEVVLDDNNHIVRDALNAGKYNFYNPTIDVSKVVNEEWKENANNPLISNTPSHIAYDVLPYLGEGNAQNDPTTMSQRFLRNLKYFEEKNAHQ